MSLDLDAIRADTDGLDVVHFNSAGSSLPPRPVIDAVVEYLQYEARVGGYEAAADRIEELDDFYDATASYLGCDPSEVAFCAGAGDAWWRAFSAIPLQAGDRILLSRSEYQANAFGFMQAEERGVELTLIPHDRQGMIDLDVLAAELDERVRIVSLTHVAMSNGAIQPAAAVGQLLADHPAIYLLDSCQAAGQIPLDVDELGCDFLVYTGRKWMRGPRATGVLYARSSVLDQLGPQPYIDGRSAEWLDTGGYELMPGARRFEYGEQFYAGRCGLAVATRYLLDLGAEHIAARTQALAARLREGLSSLPEVDVHDEGGPRGGAVTFTIRGEATPAIGATLRANGVVLSVPGRRNAQFDLGPRGLDAVIRAAPHYFNTADEIDRAIAVVATI